MENAHHAPIATPEQRQALRRNQLQRLRDQAEALLRAVEDLDPPKTHKEAEQVAKTLLAVGKVLDAVHDIRSDDVRYMPACNVPPDPVMEREALTSWKAIVDASLEVLAQARALKREGA
ncbi:MAG TPA: hypothetical protein VHC50_01330 [Puia sp.]|nr:hypothetical protein [Puia sp.]